MFEPSTAEITATPDLFEQLLAEGRKLMRTPQARNERLREQQEESAARAVLAAQRAMERFQWRPRASVALIHNLTCCRCGSETQLFAGFGVAMYRNSDRSERLVMTPVLDPAWPHETHYTNTIKPACMSCIVEDGFEVQHGKA